ncbi:hypothetical protein THIOKS11010002 [Thiocapsa sp. KS1]|nr:M23 family metallopeptidase [Thiocapsa sp. KS1]CRI62860.1 hypothetical protein THIOKS11010002 [Thiocapsa sp. KS1]
MPMSEVKFSANPSAVLKALADIRRELDRTGQAGRKLSEIDFGFPSLASFEEDMRRLQTQFAAYQRLAPGSTLARGLRNSGQATAEAWNVDWAKAFPDQAQRRQAQARLSQLPAAFAGAPISGHAEQRQSGGTGLPGFIPTTPMGAAGALVGLALGSSIGKAVAEGMANARAHDASADQALRWSNVTRDFESLRREIGGVGKGLGVIEAEGAKLALTFARSSGAIDGAAGGARTALGLAAGLGMDPNATAERMGSLQFMGAVGAKDKASQKEFAAMFAEVLTRNGLNARGEQVLSDLSSSVQRMTQQYLRPTDINGLMAFAQGVYSSENAAVRARGVSGMAGGAETLTGYDGADLERSMFHYRMLADDFTTDPFLVRRITERGPFSRPGEATGSSDTRTLYELAMEQADQDLGPNVDPNFKSAYLANMAGVSMDQADEMLRIYKEFGKAGIGSLQARMKAAGIDLESLTDVSGISGAAKVMAAENDPQALRAAMEQIIKDRDISGAKADELRGLSGTKLADALIRLEAEGGRTSTPTSDLNEAIRKLSDDFAAFGNELNQAKLDLTEGMSALTDPLNKIVGAYEAITGFRKEHVPDMEAAGLEGGEVFGAWAGTGASWWIKYRQWQEETFAPSKGGRSGRNRRTGKPQETEEAPEDDSSSPLLDFFFGSAEASSLPFQSAFDINPPLSPGQRAQRAMTAPKSVAQGASGTYPFQSEIQAAAKKHGVPEWALASIIAQESGFNPQAVGDNDSSWGMGQFNKHGAAADFGLTKEDILAMSPAEQIDDIGEFLKMKLKQAKGDIDRAIELYNGGGDKFYRKNVEARRRELGLGGIQLGSPLADVDVTSQFGSRKHPISGKVQSHNGVDLAAAEGTPVYAPADGTVARSGFQKGKAGYYSVLDHGDGTQSKFFHLQEAAADAGTAYKKGDVIGRTGNTGGSTGPHLHYELWRDGKAVDPMKDAGMDWNQTPSDALPKELVGDQVSQRIGTSLRQEPAPPVSLSLNMFQNPITGAMHVEADRQGSGSMRIAYGAGQWGISRPRETA